MLAAADIEAEQVTVPIEEQPLITIRTLSIVTNFARIYSVLLQPTRRK
jgi:hypothetical protein